MIKSFMVKDAVTGLGIESAKVVVRKLSDNSLVQSGLTDADGKIDLDLLSDVQYTVLAYKVDAYEGVRVSLQIKNNVLYPASVSLIKVTERIFKVKTCIGNASTVLANVKVEIFDASNVLHSSWGFTDAAGKRACTLPANLAGWKCVLTSPGVDGVSFSLDKIDLVGEVVVIFAPIIGSDE